MRVLVLLLAGCVGQTEVQVFENPEQTPFTQALLDCEGDGGGPSCLEAARILAVGEGTEADPAGACGYYGRACDGGQTEGCREQARCLELGTVEAANPAAARDLYLVACGRGDRPACEAVFDILEKGREGLPPDPDGAHNLLEQGCKAGDAEACSRLEPPAEP